MKDKNKGKNKRIISFTMTVKNYRCVCVGVGVCVSIGVGVCAGVYVCVEGGVCRERASTDDCREGGKKGGTSFQASDSSVSPQVKVIDV